MEMIEIGSLAIQLYRKPIKNLHINVLPPDGKIRVSAPANMTDTAIRMAVIKRIPWIRKQQKSFADQPRQSERQMVRGETHYLWGRPYRLDVLERTGKHEVQVARSWLRLYVNRGTTAENRELAVNAFYREELKTRITRLLPYWQHRMGISVQHWGIKRMKTKWGSCNTKARRIWLNLELAKKPVECLEYILVHELAHLLENTHNDRFKAHMDSFMPDWRDRRDLLNSKPLAHESWDA